MKGVLQTRVGYTGGSASDPTYGSVCGQGKHGHTEAIKVDFDPSLVEYTELLDVFFTSHHPDSRVKDQYKSAIWTTDNAQHALAVEYSKKAGVALLVEPAKQWYDAEEYHQKYLFKSGRR